MKNIVKFFKTNKIDYNVNFDLTNHNTFKIKCIARYFVKVSTYSKLRILMEFLHTNNIKYFILGNGSNVVFVNSHYNGVVISLNFKKVKLYTSYGRPFVWVGAGVSVHDLIWYLYGKGYAGLEWAVGIPASVGGAVCMNMGAHGNSIAENVKNVIILSKNGKIMRKNAKRCNFSYRNSNFRQNDDIILGATFYLKAESREGIKSRINEYIALRRQKQPMGPSAGSVFKNADKPAGYLIDCAGLKGCKVGGAVVSEKHANFILNGGNATGRDILKLVKVIKRRVYSMYKVDLEYEVCFVK